MKVLSKYIKKYYKLFFLAVFFLTIEAFCDLLQPTVMSKIIDIGVAKKNADYVINMGAVMLLITGVGAIAAVTRNIISSNVSLKFGAELRGDCFTKIQELSLENIDKLDGASLVTRLTNDVTQIQNFINGLMRIFVKAPLLCIGSLIMTVRLNPRMALVFLGVIPLVAILIYINMKKGYPYFIKIQKALDKVNGVMREYLSGVRLVKAFNRFDFEVFRFGSANDELTDISIKAMKVMSIFSPGISLIVNIGIVSILWIGGYMVNSGTMHVGEIIAFTNYMTQILFSLTIMSMVFTMMVRAKASLLRIEEILQQEPKVKIKENPVVSIPENISVNFKNVYFSYTGDIKEAVLKNINFSINKGETIGIIGSTGSGKSSLVKLISRFYNVTSGSIKIGEIDISDLDIKVLRNKIAFVPQKTMLFSGSIMDNIKWGKEDASLSEIIEASKTARAHDFISKFPEAYNTMLGQGGVNISGGQKQRISIARALIKKPEIIILDDCTSAVDVTTELEIREGLKTYLKDLTSIIIAQRITSVMNADKIMVLDDGEIVDTGSHKDLLLRCPAYKDIYRSQIGREVL